MLKNNIIIKTNRIKLNKFDYKTVFLFCLFLCGIIIGICVIKNCGDDVRNIIYKYLENYLSVKNQNSFFECFLGCYSILSVYVFANFLFGLCAVGTPLVCIIPIVFGFFCGSGVSCFFLKFGLKGLCYCGLVLVPCYAITAATIIMCCCESSVMSIQLFNCIKDGRFNKINLSFNDFLLKHLILCIPIAIGALISTIGFRLFSSLFIFA